MTVVELVCAGDGFGCGISAGDKPAAFARRAALSDSI